MPAFSFGGMDVIAVWYPAIQPALTVLVNGMRAALFELNLPGNCVVKTPRSRRSVVLRME